MNLVAAFFSWCNAEDFHAQFAADLRTPLFVVFVSLSAFLFAIKAMLVTTLKREVCDTDSYRRLLAIQRVANPEFGHYAPLRRLSNTACALPAAVSLHEEAPPSGRRPPESPRLVRAEAAAGPSQGRS